MRKLPLFVLVACLISSIATAQSNYKPGYVITPGGDTLKGYINYLNWRINPGSYEFKSSITETRPKIFDLNNAISVSVTGFENYKLFSLLISLDESDELRLRPGLDARIKMDTVFLKLINSGKFVSLYSYADKIKVRYFIAENGQRPFELILHRYLDPNQPSQTVVVDSYKRQLQAVAFKFQPQNEELTREISKADFTLADMEDLVFKINGSEKVRTFSSSQQYRTKLFLGIGATFATATNVRDEFSISGRDPIYTAHIPVGIEFNIGGDVNLLRTEKSLIFRAEVHFSFNANDQISSENTVVQTYKFFAVNLNPQLLYNVLNKKDLKIYIAGGLQLALYGGVNGPLVVFLPTPSYKNFTLYPTINAGLTISNRLNLYAGYTPNIDNNATNRLNIARIGVNYWFGN